MRSGQSLEKTFQTSSSMSPLVVLGAICGPAPCECYKLSPQIEPEDPYTLSVIILLQIFVTAMSESSMLINPFLPCLRQWILELNRRRWLGGLLNTPRPPVAPRMTKKTKHSKLKNPPTHQSASFFIYLFCLFSIKSFSAILRKIRRIIFLNHVFGNPGAN